MKRLMTLGTFLLIAMLGCTPNPTPQEAVKFCIEKGGNPSYSAGPGWTRFECYVKDKS